METHVRRGETVDAMRIVELVNAAYSGPEAHLGWTPETHLHSGPRTNIDSVSGYLNSSDMMIIMAERANKAVGCALLERDGAVCKFGMFAVYPRFQASGIGKLIMTYAETRARTDWQCHLMAMTAIDQQEALIAFYERRGFVRTGETLPFPHDEEPGALRFDFHLVALQKRLI